MKIKCLAWIAVFGLIVLCWTDIAFAQEHSSLDSASTMGATIQRDTSVWERFTPDTTRTDLAGGLTNFGYVTARAFGVAWQFLWKQAVAALTKTGEFLEKVLGDEDREKSFLRLPFSQRK